MITSSVHNHCSFCDGASAFEEMLSAAKSAGITDFGISCHAHADFDGVGVADERDYIDSVRLAKNSLATGVNLYLGVEEDYFTPVKFRGEYDYIIGAAHYIKIDKTLYAVDYDEKTYENAIEAAGGERGFIQSYYATVVETAKKRPDILAHFDLITRYAKSRIDTDSEFYKSTALDALSACLSAGVILELNYGGITRGGLTEPYPARFLLEYAKSNGGRVIVSTDCHHAKNIAAGLSEGEKLLRSLGFRSLAAMRPKGFMDERL